jgi:carbon-monoxide dehydrogenase large subunit
LSILGTRVLRTEDPRFLTGGDTYIDNLDVPGAAHAVYVRSTIAHARVTGVDTADAAAMPGVIAVFTGADVDLADKPPANARCPEAMRRPLLARDVVRFVGEPVAVVVAETRVQAVDAAEQVVVDYDPLPAVVDPEAALADGAVLLFPEAETNVAMRAPLRHGDELFDGCDVVVRERIVNPRVAPCPLEPRAGAARWEPDGRLTHWACTQHPHATRNGLADTYGLERDRVHVITPDVGGGFGAKSGTYPEELLLAWLARRVDRPVRWTETRTESMLALAHGRAQVQYATLGGTRDGKLLAYQLRIVQDAGAYADDGVVLPYLTRMMAPGVYDLTKVDVDITAVLTNTTPVAAYRGAGRPEATAAIERMVDRFAVEVGMDPAEVRRRNLLGPDVFPYTTPMRVTYDSGDYEGALDRALAAAGYDDLRAEQARRRDAGDDRLLGIGLSVYVEITNGGGEEEFGSIEVLPDDSTGAHGSASDPTAPDSASVGSASRAVRAIVRTGTSPHGQGHATVFAMLAADATGIPFERIEVRHGDTDDVPRGNGTGGSRSLQAGGSAVQGAADELVRVARDLAAEMLEANVDDVVLDRDAGRFHVAGTPAIARSWAEIAAEFADRNAGGDGAAASPTLQAAYDFDPPQGTFPFGAHVAVVEIDRATGRVTLLRHVACDDAGRIMNPLVVDGQVHGGVAQGASQALYEEMRFDDDGNPLTANFMDYPFPSAAEFPMFERVEMETPTPLNPLGAKGIGESGTIGSTPAVQNAIVDALAHLGVTHVDMPCTPERVWAATRDANAKAGR